MKVSTRRILPYAIALAAVIITLGCGDRRGASNNAVNDTAAQRKGSASVPTKGPDDLDSIDLDARIVRSDGDLCAELRVRNRSSQEYVMLPSFVNRGPNSKGKYRLVSDPGSLGIDVTWNQASPVPEVLELNRVWPQYAEGMVVQFILVPARSSIRVVTELRYLADPKNAQKGSQALFIASIPLWRRGNARLEGLFSKGLASTQHRYRVVADTGSTFQSYILGSDNHVRITFDEFLLLQAENLGFRMKQGRWVFFAPS